MKVLIVSSGLPSTRYPLEGVFAYDQAKALASQDLDVTFFSIDLRSIRKIRRFGFDSFVRDNVKCYTFSVPLGPIGYGILNRVGCIVGNILYKRVYKKDIRPDIIHTHFAASYGAFLSTKYDIPLVITEHSSEMNRIDLPQLVIDRALKSYGKANAVISVSSLLAESLYKKTGITSRVIHNIIDTGLFSALPKVSHPSFTFVTTALLSERKRIHQLIPAVMQCPETVRLIIIGDGPERPRIEQLIKENQLAGRVKMKGLLSREETAKIYAESDCFVLPSALETFGVVYVEAMAAGLPVIATRCGGPEDFVTEDNGLLIDVDNQNQLINAMHYMIDNVESYSEERIKEFANSNFSPNVIANQIIELYKKIVKQ